MAMMQVRDLEADAILHVEESCSWLAGGGADGTIAAPDYSVESIGFSFGRLQRPGCSEDERNPTGHQCASALFLASGMCLMGA